MADGDITITLDDPSDEESPVPALPEPDDEGYLNIAKKWGGKSKKKGAKLNKNQERLKQIGEDIVRDFDSEMSATEEYRDQMADAIRLMTGDLQPKTFPFKNCANLHLPILLENIPRLQLRAFAELFSDEKFFCYRSPAGEDSDVARVVTEHTLWQLRTQIPDFYRQQHRGLLMYFMHGDVCCHSYRDEVREQNRHEMLTPDEFVTPYAHVTTMPDYSDVPWIVKIHFRYKYDIEAMRDRWYGVDQVLEEDPEDDDTEPENKGKKGAADSKGIDTDDATIAPYRLLWFEGRLDLGKEYGGSRFCRAIVDHRTKIVLELCLHEEDDWRDALRANRQTAELDMHLQALTAHEQATQKLDEQSQVAMQTQMEVAHPLAQEMNAQAMQQIEQQRIQLDAMKPKPPGWLKGEDPRVAMVKPPKKVPIHLFAHGVNIEPLQGSLGFGYGRIQKDYNVAADTLMDQFADAATLANVKTFLATDAIEIAQEGLELVPGKINRIPNATATDLKQNLIPLEFGQANPQVIELVQMTYQWGQSSMQSPNVLSGAEGKSGETARGIMERIGQATKQLSVTTQKYAAEFLTQILRNNAKLNSKYLSDEEVYEVVDQESQKTIKGTASRKLYEMGYEVEIRADMRFVSQEQKVQEADDAYKMITAPGPLQGNFCLAWRAAKACFVARKRWDLVTALGPEPPPPAQPMGTPPPMPPGGPGGPPGAPPGPPGGPPPGPPQMAGGHGPGGPQPGQPMPPKLTGPAPQPGGIQ